MGTGTGTIFIQWGGDEYHTTRTRGYPLTSLVLPYTRCEFIYHRQAVHKKARVVGRQRHLSGQPSIGTAEGDVIQGTKEGGWGGFK